MRHVLVLVAIFVASASLLAAGCDPRVPADTGIVPEQGCLLDVEHFADVSIEPTLVPTVFEASWTTTEPGLGQVMLSAGDEPWFTPLEDGVRTDHQALLVGSPALSTIQVRLVNDVDGELLCSESYARSTPAPPPELPVLALDEAFGGAGPGGWSLLPLGSEFSSVPALVDDQGRYCWWMQDDGYYFYADLAQDGRGLLLLDSPSAPDGQGRIVEVGFDGELLGERVVDGAHNHLVSAPDGAIYLLGRERYEVEIEGEPVSMLSDTVIELLPDGEQTVLWSARTALFDAMYAVICQRALEAPPGDFDWTHGTTLAYDEQNDLLVVALTGANTILALDRATGAVEWMLGGDAATLEGSQALVSIPHSVQVFDDRVLLYNQRYFRHGEECGEATEIKVDLESSSAELAWWGREPDCGTTDVLGSAYRTADGGTLMSGGTLGRLSWFDASGELTWRLTADLGTTLGGASHVAAFR